MNVIDRFCFTVLNPSDHQLIGKGLAELQQTAFASRESLDEIQSIKLKKLFHAALQVPYWSDQLQEPTLSTLQEKGVRAALETLPMLTKAVIRNGGTAMWSTQETEYITATTGGTTGHPLTIRRDKASNAYTKSAFWRGRLSWGIRPSTKMVYLISFGTASWLGNLKMWLGNKRTGDAFPSTQEDVQQVQKLLKRFRPKALEGFATGLLASIQEDLGSSSVKIPVIISTGEMLYEHQRKQLESFYGGKVYTYYGSNEVGSIAYECEHQQLHVCEEHVILETVNEEGKNVLNEPGTVLVTDLDNKAMPFIRYQLGDRATLSNKPCACGRKSLVIAELMGRSQDYLSAPNGHKLQATQLSAYLKDLVHVGQIQFVQQSESEIQIVYTGNAQEAAHELEFVQQHLRNRLGAEIQLENHWANEIPKTNRGKQPLVVRKDG